MKNSITPNFTKPTIITAQQYGTKVSVELDHSDTDIDELMEAFHTLVVGLGYHQSAWKQWVLDKADEYKEEDGDDEDEFVVEFPTNKSYEYKMTPIFENKDEDESEFNDYGMRAHYNHD